VTETREGYDLWADSYDDLDNPLVAMASLARERLAATVAGARVLELGCGTGRNRAFFLEAGARTYVGVDASAGMLGRARSLQADDRCRWIEADVTRPLPADLRGFDLVVSSLVLEHVEDLAPVFRNASAAVREGGRMVIHELHADLRAEGTRAHFRAGGREHVLPSYPHDAREYEAELAAAGWEVEDITSWVATEAACRASAKLAKHLGKPVLVEVTARRVHDGRLV